MTASHSRIRQALAAALLGPACSRPGPPAATADKPPATDVRSAPPVAPARSASVPEFADKIWKVARSSAGDPGTYYVFLADGSMLITSPHGTPAVGRWRYAADVLTLVEEGLPHPATILRSTADSLEIRITSPGEPVRITFVRVAAP